LRQIINVACRYLRYGDAWLARDRFSPSRVPLFHRSRVHARHLDRRRVALISICVPPTLLLTLAVPSIFRRATALRFRRGERIIANLANRTQRRKPPYSSLDRYSDRFTAKYLTRARVLPLSSGRIKKRFGSDLFRRTLACGVIDLRPSLLVSMHIRPTRSSVRVRIASAHRTSHPLPACFRKIGIVFRGVDIIRALPLCQTRSVLRRHCRVDSRSCDFYAKRAAIATRRRGRRCVFLSFRRRNDSRARFRAKFPNDDSSVRLHVRMRIRRTTRAST